jgi:hypothetical protein
MENSRHGLTIGIERINNNFYLSFKAIGKLTHEDYKTITPIIDKALEEVKEPKIDAFVDCTQLEGWELEAAWDDFKLGLKHGSKFEKIAILGNQNWLNIGSKVASWFIHGEVKYFENEKEAFYWLHG